MRRNKFGFGLIEILISVAFVGLGYLAYTKLMVNSVKKTVVANQEYAANQSADYIIKRARQNLLYAESSSIYMSASHYAENSYADDTTKPSVLDTANENKAMDARIRSKVDLYLWKEAYNKALKIDYLKAIVCQDTLPYGVPTETNPNCKANGKDTVVKLVWRTNSDAKTQAATYSNLVRIIPVDTSFVYKNTANPGKCSIAWESKANGTKIGCSAHEDCSGKFLMGDCAANAVCKNSYVMGNCYGNCDNSVVMGKCTGQCNSEKLTSNDPENPCYNAGGIFDKAICKGFGAGCGHSIVAGSDEKTRGCQNSAQCPNNIVFGDCISSTCSNSIIFGNCAGGDCSYSIIFGNCSGSNCNNSYIMGNCDGSCTNSTITGSCTGSSCSGSGADIDALLNKLLPYFDSYVVPAVNVNFPVITTTDSCLTDGICPKEQYLNCIGTCDNKVIYGNCKNHCEGSTVYGDCDGNCDKATIYGNCTGYGSCEGATLVGSCLGDNCKSIKRPVNMNDWDSAAYKAKIDALINNK